MLTEAIKEKLKITANHNIGKLVSTTNCKLFWGISSNDEEGKKLE